MHTETQYYVYALKVAYTCCHLHLYNIIIFVPLYKTSFVRCGVPVHAMHCIFRCVLVLMGRVKALAVTLTSTKLAKRVVGVHDLYICTLVLFVRCGVPVQCTALHVCPLCSDG